MCVPVLNKCSSTWLIHVWLWHIMSMYWYMYIEYIHDCVTIATELIDVISNFRVGTLSSFLIVGIILLSFQLSRSIICSSIYCSLKFIAVRRQRTRQLLFAFCFTIFLLSLTCSKEKISHAILLIFTHCIFVCIFDWSTVYLLTLAYCTVYIQCL